MSNSLIQYWDSDVLIHALQRTPEHLAEIEQLINEAENGNIQILLSNFTLMEIYKDLDGINATSKEDDELIVAFFENPYFIFKDLTQPIALSARQISREFGILPKDAVHVATALYYSVPVLFSYDGKLLNKNGKIGSPPLEIVEPYWIGQPELAGLDAEIIEEVEAEKAIETTLPILALNANGNEDRLQIEAPKILLLEQTNEKENIETGETTTTLEQSVGGAEQE